MLTTVVKTFLSRHLVWIVAIVGSTFSSTTYALAVIICTVSNTGIAFPNYTSSLVIGTGNVAITCSSTPPSNVSYTIGLSTGGSVSFTNRTLKLAGKSLNYNLYKDSVRLNVWGDGTVGSSLVLDTKNFGILPSTINYTVYGAIPGSQYQPAGTYSDVITVTVTY